MQQTGKKYLYSLMNGAIKNRIEAQRGKQDGWGREGDSEDRKGVVSTEAKQKEGVTVEHREGGDEEEWAGVRGGCPVQYTHTGS